MIDNSCGCVFCDIGLDPDVKIDNVKFHHIPRRGNILCERKTEPTSVNYDVSKLVTCMEADLKCHSEIERLGKELEQTKVDCEQYQQSRDLFAGYNMDLQKAFERSKSECERLEKENTYLRGIVQRNPEWKCVHGHQIETMAMCPSGFPGCACADDLMLSEDEAWRNSQRRFELCSQENEALQTELQESEDEIARLKKQPMDADSIRRYAEEVAIKSARAAIETIQKVFPLLAKEVFNDDQVKHMVDRFLAWRLPENFNPDGGISFKKTFNDHMPTPMKHEPTGTNLFDVTQADAMVRYMIEGMTK